MSSGPSAEATLKKHISRVLDGDRNAYRFIIEAYQRKVFSISLCFTRSVPAAEDLTQDTFLAVYESLHRFDLERSFTNWILRIATNHGLKFKRKKRAIPSDKIEISVEPEPLANLINEEQQRLVIQALEKLPEEQKLALWLYYFLDQSYAQIAEILEMPLHLVKIRLFRGKKTLGELLQISRPEQQNSCNLYQANGKIDHIKP